ncbi:pyridoxal-phosphate dependent enzyme [Roseobacter sinensis]|uniref:Pyridoxal-phosphate dependent enzyme n=1 Tax=Roseobacter sinensis TaxID=2931391 RepID=A0ABT3BDS1_9RHOB|nr:pyridoxal-phosphate dependent enzyme [Roseobacter sp. WL0113]MCV3271328.1 pyridoxal-phosphate dependent enzyme [Roseobacter sp. WL0113]
MSPSPSVLRQAALSVAAQRRIAPYLAETPCIPSRRHFTDGTGLVFKAENLQRTGSFKFRGALSKLTALGPDTPIITASSGNHGLALSTAAQITGHALSVVLPHTVAREKRDKIEALGVRTILHSDDSGLAEQHARALAETDGKIYVSPYNDETVIAGQGTIGLELLQQVPKLDVVFISMGGGGLISGIGSVLKAFSPETRVVGVSTANSAALDASIGAGRVVEVRHQETLADGCAGGIDEGTLTLPLATEVIDERVTCSEDQIADGVRALAWEEKMLVEGSAGLALAPWRLDPARYAGLASAVVLCGANFDRDTILPVIAAGT